MLLLSSNIQICFINDGPTTFNIYLLFAVRFLLSYILLLWISAISFQPFKEVPLLFLIRSKLLLIWIALYLLFWMIILPGRKILGCKFFFLALWLSHITPFYKVSKKFLLKNLLKALWNFLCMWRIIFPLLFLRSMLILNFIILVITCLGEDLFDFMLFGTLSVSWTWISVFVSVLRNISAIIPSNNFF